MALPCLSEWSLLISGFSGQRLMTKDRAEDRGAPLLPATLWILGGGGEEGEPHLQERCLLTWGSTP